MLKIGFLNPVSLFNLLKRLNERTALSRFSDLLIKTPALIIFTVAYSMVISIVASDFVAGSWMGLSRFLLVPIALVAWTRGERAGILIAIASGLAWAIEDVLRPQPYAHPVEPFWNAGVRLALFLACAIVLSALKEALEDEKKAARTDFLTDVANRRHFFELANAEIRRSKRYRHSFIVAYLDIDDFKNVNDIFGHNQGDALLRLVASTMKGSVREVDIVARVGGDEFAILFPETGPSVAKDVMKKVQSNLRLTMKYNNWAVTFSIGTAAFETPPVSVDEMIKRADTLMYAVKNSGKNTIQYEVFGQPS